MLEQESDCTIINTSSKQGITCPPRNTAYNVSKAGVKNQLESVRILLAAGADVNAVSSEPGDIDANQTDMGNGPCGSQYASTLGCQALEPDLAGAETACPPGSRRNRFLQHFSAGQIGLQPQTLASAIGARHPSSRGARPTVEICVTISIVESWRKAARTAHCFQTRFPSAHRGVILDMAEGASPCLNCSR
jgi:NAD(P)-dependent dehydrogenase (short-subunit alcohol dehydrogenase family)